MVSRSESCPIAIAKELWEAIDTILVKHGCNTDKNQNIDGIAIFAFDGDRGMNVTVLGQCSAENIIKVMAIEAVKHGNMAAIRIG